MTMRWRFWARVVALAAVVAGLLAPNIRLVRPVYTVLSILDITGSMNTVDAADGGETISRIALEKRSLHRLLASLPCGSRLGLGVFVEKVPFLMFEPVEVCGNFSALDLEISQIDWRMGWDSESHIADALRASMLLAQREGADLLFMTDGQESPPLWWTGMPKFTALSGSVHGVIEGLGGTQLVPIPRFDTNGHQIGFYRAIDVPSDKDGMFAGHGNLSAEDAPHLRQLASLTGLHYRHLGGAGQLLADEQRYGKSVPRAGFYPLTPYFAALALLLLVVASLPDFASIFTARAKGAAKVTMWENRPATTTSAV